MGKIIVVGGNFAGLTSALELKRKAKKYRPAKLGFGRSFHNSTAISGKT